MLRPAYDALYRMNVGVDFIDPSSTNLEQYRLIVVPALYAAPDALLERLNRFVKDGGHVVYTFKSGFSDEHVKVRATPQPGIIGDGVRRLVHAVHHPQGRVGDEPVPAAEGQRRRPVLDGAAHADDRQSDCPVRSPGLGPVRRGHRERLREGARDLRRLHAERRADGAGSSRTPSGRRGSGASTRSIAFPLITKSGTNQQGKIVRYYFNYSARAATFRYPHDAGRISSTAGRREGSQQQLPPWGVTDRPRGLEDINPSTHLTGYGSGFRVPGSRFQKIGVTVRTLVPVWRWYRRTRADFGIPAWNPELIRHRNPTWNLVRGTRNRTQHKRVPGL